MFNMRISRLSVLFIFISEICCSDAKLELKPEYNHTSATNCIKNIIKVYYHDKVLTFFNFNAENMEILKAVHSLCTLSIMNRRPPKKIYDTNRGYIIYALTAEDFKSNFLYVVGEAAWTPYAKFGVVVETLEVDQLEGMFQVLLGYHVKDVIIIDGLTADTYTYDPFKNNGCFKSFDQIIPLGKCLADMPPDYFPNTLKNGLRNCTLQVAATHWPPYTVDPTQTDIDTIGMDEYIYSIIAKQEHFNVNISYFPNLSDEVSSVDENMVATGALQWLQEPNRYDAMTGSYLLVAERAAAFTYVCGHLAHDDYIRIIVRQAGDVRTWKLLLLAFNPLVWLLLGITFLTVSVLLIVISSTTDRSLLIFNLIDYIFMHTCRIRRTKRLDFILIFWFVFACLIDYHYLSVVYSITTKPMQDYQIAQLSDKDEYNLQPCLSDAIQIFHTLTSALSGLDINPTAEAKHECNTMGNSLETVSKSHNLYTVVPYSLYHANRYKFYDKYGKNLLFSFPKPLSRIIYASYFYKGFPLYDKFNIWTMRVNEAGLTTKIWRDYDYFQRKLHQTQITYRKPTVTVPWYIILIGGFISAMCFLGEIISHNCKSDPFLNKKVQVSHSDIVAS